MKHLKLLAAIGLCLTITACGSKKEDTGSQQATTDDSNAVRIAMWDTNQEKVMKEIVKDFEKANPDIKVQIEMATYKDHFTKLETQSSGSVMPDIFFMNGPNFIKFASNNVLEPLDDLVKSGDIDIKSFPQSLVDLYTYDGKIYGIPKDWDLTALWYNKELFDKAGVEYPTDEWTWDDMAAAAEKLTDEKNGVYGIAAQAFTQEGLYDTIPQCGGFIISEDMKKSGYDTPEALDGTQRWIDFIEKKQSPDLQTMTDTKGVELFKAGKVAMIYSASWNIPEYMNSDNIKDKVDLVVMPKIKERAATIHGLSYAIAAQSKNKENAKTFLKYLASQEVNDKWADSGAVIPANQKSLDKWLKSYPNINLKAFVDELEYAKPYPISKNTSKWNELENNALNDMFSLQKKPEEVLKDLAEKMNQALSEEK
ncbi:MAG: sugar ABC transporter substrate-binding protein [Peptoniphilaceae bacterium]|nr:sugar ABC transporter substrate-binding protein [Peptoniphilaceae bacterium]MDY6019016.1 sugar ABC transporter substrate-binding protein [Anaerococcus sp.]